MLSGALYFLAFPGMDVWPLGFVALVPLILALRRQTPRRGLLLGWLAGLTMTSLGFYWLIGMLQTFSGFPLPLCVLFATLLSAYQGGRIALLGWLTTRAEGRGWPPWLAFGLAFPTSELVFPLLFPWYYAASVHQVPVLLQWAELGGPLAVGLALVAANLALSECAVAALERRRPRLKAVLAFTSVPVLATVYGLVRIPMIDSATKKAEPVRVALVQADMSLLGKRLNPEESLQRHLSLTRGAMQGKPVDLVVWSETSIGGAIDERNANAYYKQRVGSQLPVPTIFGAVLRRPVDDARRYTLSNSALITDAAGDVVGRYDKQFLLGFGEYLPFGETFPILYEWSPNSGRFSPGTSFDPLPAGKHTVATFICYEDIIPSFVNKIMGNGDPELLVNLTNDAWFGDTTQPWIHLALAKLRAIEQRRFFVRSTNSGVSAFIDPVGRVMARTPVFTEVAIAEDLRWLDSTTLYRILGDAPWWLLAMGSFALAFVRRPNGESRLWRRRVPKGGAAAPAPAGTTDEPEDDAGPPSPPATAEPAIGNAGSAPATERAPAMPGSGGSDTSDSPLTTTPLAPPATPALDPGEFGAFPKPGKKPGDNSGSDGTPE